MLGGGLIDWHAGGGEERRAILTVTETTSRVQHAWLAQPASQTADTTNISYNFPSEQNQSHSTAAPGVTFLYFSLFLLLCVDFCRILTTYTTLQDGTTTENSLPPPLIETLIETSLITQMELTSGLPHTGSDQ